MLAINYCVGHALLQGFDSRVCLLYTGVVRVSKPTSLVIAVPTDAHLPLPSSIAQMTASPFPLRLSGLYGQVPGPSFFMADSLSHIGRVNGLTCASKDRAGPQWPGRFPRNPTRTKTCTMTAFRWSNSIGH